MQSIVQDRRHFQRQWNEHSTPSNKFISLCQAGWSRMRMRRMRSSVLLIPHMLRHTLRLLLSWVRLTLRAQCARRSTGLGGHAWNVDQWERRLRVLKRNEATRERCTTVPAFDPAASQLLRQQLLRSVGRTNNRPAPEPTAKRCFGTTCTFTLFCVYQKWQTR